MLHYLIILTQKERVHDLSQFTDVNAKESQV